MAAADGGSRGLASLSNELKAVEAYLSSPEGYVVKAGRLLWLIAVLERPYHPKLSETASKFTPD